VLIVCVLNDAEVSSFCYMFLCAAPVAVVPEAIAFAFVAGVAPLVGLYAAFIVGLITAVLVGGRE